MKSQVGRPWGAGSVAHAFLPLMAGRIDEAGFGRRLGDARRRWTAEKMAQPSHRRRRSSRDAGSEKKQPARRGCHCRLSSASVATRKLRGALIASGRVTHGCPKGRSARQGRSKAYRIPQGIPWPARHAKPLGRLRVPSLHPFPREPVD